jgi:hypothetical protein
VYGIAQYFIYYQIPSLVGGGGGGGLASFLNNSKRVHRIEGARMSESSVQHKLSYICTIQASTSI